ncbi:MULTISPECIES: ornithine cyclodeaminase [unclassified Burkholderia]|uniref:ornithine cyclodeaminase n=1 Tax=unclassified Burkholderia TaxID=2613784 RepID=UPI001E5DBFDE|nr:MULTISPECIES: ornithine cyclodeaminase [unclassified Burkholderia]
MFGRMMTSCVIGQRRPRGTARTGDVAMMKRSCVAFVMCAAMLAGCDDRKQLDAPRTTVSAFASGTDEAAENAAAPDASMPDVIAPGESPQGAMPAASAPGAAAPNTSTADTSASAIASAPDAQTQEKFLLMRPLRPPPATTSNQPITPDTISKANRVTQANPQPSPSPIQPTGQAPSATPPSAFASVDEALAKMIEGNVVFNVPTPVDIDGTCPCQIDAVLSPKESVAALQQQIAENNPSAGNFQHARIKISDRMIARLSADPDDFSIDPAGDQEQAVGVAAPVVWSWRITPNHWGRHRLRLVLKALVTVDGGAVPARLTTLDKPMLVTVTPLGRVRHFAGDNWQWLWGALLVPAFGWMWKRRRRTAS